MCSVRNQRMDAYCQQAEMTFLALKHKTLHEDVQGNGPAVCDELDTAAIPPDNALSAVPALCHLS